MASALTTIYIRIKEASQAASSRFYQFPLISRSFYKLPEGSRSFQKVLEASKTL
jgi:hypothetical protein